MVLQPNGMLLASFGRPDNTLLVSRDGTGRTWDDYVKVYANPPQDSGPARNYDHQYRVWARQVDAVTPGTGKIDLAGKVHNGTAASSRGVAGEQRKCAPEFLDPPLDLRSSAALLLMELEFII